MPVYTLLTEDMLADWLVELNNTASNLIKYPNIESFKYFIMEFYEYAQIKAGFDKKNIDGKLENAKLSLTDLKSVFSSNSDENAFIRVLKDAADSIRHELCEGDEPVKYISVSC